jgi:hypothetical protein
MSQKIGTVPAKSGHLATMPVQAIRYNHQGQSASPPKPQKFTNMAKNYAFFKYFYIYQTETLGSLELDY